MDLCDFIRKAYQNRRFLMIWAKFWKRILDKGIVDMNAGEVASVSFTNEGMVTFYLADRSPVSFEAPKFAKGFSSIWLGENTSRPRLRQKLLGK